MKKLPPKASRDRHTLYLFAAIGLVALFARIAAYTYLPPERISDAAIYDAVARNLIAGNGYSINGIDPTMERTPTYPVFLALVYSLSGGTTSAVLIVQAILGVATTFVTGWLATQLFDRRVGYLAAFLVATYPALIYYDTRLLREGFTGFLLIGTLCLSWLARAGRPWQLLLVGFALACLSMCRPETLVVFIPTVLIVSRLDLKPTRIARPAIYILLPILFVWLPWTARNYTTFGTLSPIRAGIASTVWFGNRWAATGGDDQASQDRAHLKESFQSKALGATEGELDGRFKDEIADDLLSRPLWFVEMVGKKAVMYWKDANGVRRTLPRIHPSLPILLNTYYYGLLALAVFSAWIGRSSISIRTLLYTILIYWATYALLHVRNRYRVPILPIVFILSASSLTYITGEIRRLAGLRDSTTS